MVSPWPEVVEDQQFGNPVWRCLLHRSVVRAFENTGFFAVHMIW
jgi:hypothetical protein